MRTTDSTCCKQAFLNAAVMFAVAKLNLNPIKACLSLHFPSSPETICPYERFILFVTELNSNITGRNTNNSAHSTPAVLSVYQIKPPSSSNPTTPYYIEYFLNTYRKVMMKFGDDGMKTRK